MTREEKINIIKTKFKDAIKLDFDCSGKYEGCSDCPLYKVNNGEYVYNCSEIDADQELLGQSWAESHGYIKLPEIPDEIFVNIDTHPEIVDLTLKANNPIDPINPKHYRHGEMQTIERIMMVLGPIKVKAFCEANALKYLDRSGYKGDALIDRQKADWYLRLARELDNAVSVSVGMDLLKMFLKKEEEKNGRDSNRNASGNH